MYKMSVPIEAQSKNSTCWHASALMLWRHSQQETGRQGPMNTMANKWENNNPIFPTEFIELAEKVGLMSIHTPNLNYGAIGMEVLMRLWGPLWCAGHWYGPGHIIVLTGIDGDTVYINDPDMGKRKTGTLKWFNEKLDGHLAGAVMAKDPTAY